MLFKGMHGKRGIPVKLDRARLAATGVGLNPCLHCDHLILGSRKMATKKFILSLILACLSIGKALAFEEDGFRTGMTMQEVQELLPKGRKLDHIDVKDGYVWSFVVDKDGPPRIKPGRPEFTFCFGLLMSYSRPIRSAREHFLALKALLERYGQPSKVEVTDHGGILSQGIVWSMPPERIYLSLRAPNPREKKTGTILLFDVPGISYTTQDPSCGPFEEPVRRPWRIVPFGTIGMLDTDSAATGTPR